MRGAHENRLVALEKQWQASFQAALACWSRFTKLAPPRWCLTIEDEKRENLWGSFAMIRLEDHAVVISLRQIEERGLMGFPREILAHEIGHHVYAPGDLRDNARLIARTRAGLPTREGFAATIANLYSDLLINDRLQRSAELDLVGVYKTLKVPQVNKLWTLYLRIYEVLWSLPSGTLVEGPVESSLQGDADLGARLVRAYGKYWLGGAGRFATLCLPYVLELALETVLSYWPPWLDTLGAGSSGTIPDGLAEIGEDELEGAIHPAEDEELAGLGTWGWDDEEVSHSSPEAGGRAWKGGKKNRYRSPSEYLDLMKSVGVTVDEVDLVIRYYRERAVPHLIRFPSREIRQSADPLPEGLDLWEPGQPLAEVDWMESMVRSPVVIPGITTFKRSYGTTEGSDSARQPVDLYLGVDCSGSMSNPRYHLSYPVLAGSVIVLSALRAGAQVMVTLSGEPGKYSSTPGFIHDERRILSVLTSYLGTGNAFGILRLKETFLDAPPPKRPTHILVVTDSDIFAMLDRVESGWSIAQQAVAAAGGGGTFVLELPHPHMWRNEIDQLRDCGFEVHLVYDMQDLVSFARAFSKQTYQRGGETRR